MNNNSGEWIAKLLTSVGSYANLMTTDGIERGGRITGFALRSFVFNGKRIDVPIEIELNGDPNDRIPLDRISQLDVG